VRGLAISSHNIPLSVFAEYVKRTTGAKVVLLGIQPEKIELGGSLTGKVKETAHEIVSILVRVLE